jgi:hypothetical protein
MALTIKRGVTLILLASLSFAFMGGFVKLLTLSLPSIEITFFRNSVGVMLSDSFSDNWTLLGIVLVIFSGIL